MSETMRNFWVGMFVLASLVVLATLMVWFGEVPDWLQTSEWNLRITGVRQLSGIEVGSEVNLNGVPIGRVKAIDFADPQHPDRGVVVVCGIKEQFYVPTDSVAHLYGATLGFGMGHVLIIPKTDGPAAPLPKTDAVIRGFAKSAISELISKESIDSVERTIAGIGELASAAKPVAENLADLLEQRTIDEVDKPGAAVGGITANVATVIERLDRFIANLDKILGDEQVRDDVKLAVSELRRSAQSVRDTVDVWNSESRKLAENLNAGIDTTEEHLDSSFTLLNQVLENLDDSTRSLVTAMRNIEEGHGTMGLLVRDERLYEAAVLAVQRFSAVMANLEVITGKVRDDGYITVGQAPTGLLRKRFPIGARAAGTE
jgi:ABC-type transporter Mla subunit MlaD